MLLIGDAKWLWPAAAILAAALVVLWLAYRGIRGERRVHVACAVLKAIGFVLLAVFLVEPLWSSVRVRSGANLVLIVADNSRSLEIRDAGSERTRGDALKSLLAGGRSSWQARLEQDFDVRRYQFASGLASSEEPAGLDFSGSGSRLHGVLHALGERFRGRPVAGVLLLTDGNATDRPSLNMPDLPPVYPVPIGSDAQQTDLAITHVAVNQTAFEDAPVAVQAEVTAAGLAGRDVVARVVDERQTVVAELTQRTSTGTDETSLTFRFQLRPPETGVSFYTVEVRAEGESDVPERAGDAAASSGKLKADQDARVGRPVLRDLAGAATGVEATLENNRRLIQIDRGSGRKRILYVSGRPNWEFKFLRRALEQDPSLELAALLRIARREAKFDFRGRAGESSNPLFRGFKQEADADTESYDEPVIVRLNMRNGEELRGGFPTSADELFGFHAVVLDDLEAAFFTPDQLDLLERFVSERGGGLLMLGGQESFAEGGYEHTPVARLLPVYMDRAARRTEFHSVQTGGDSRSTAFRHNGGRSETPSYGAVADGSYRMFLTREGWLQPWTRLRANETDEQERLEQMPAFQTLNRAGGTRPGATVLAEAVDQARRRHPALVGQRYGHGRAAALLVGDLWRWRLQQSPESDDHGKAWRQAIRWLVADVPAAVTVEAQALDSAAPGTVRLRVQAHDSEFQPIQNAAVELMVHAAGEEPVRLHAEPSLDAPGLFEALYVARQTGPCRVVATVTDESGAAAGTAETGWVSDPAAGEFDAVRVDSAFLQQLAARTGGRVVEPGDLDEFAASLSTRDAPITERWTWPFWHQEWVFALVIACFIGEWGLRRMKGLP